MGCGDSSVSDQSSHTKQTPQASSPAPEREPQLAHMPEQFTKKEFQAQRGANTIESALEQLSSIGTNLKGLSPDSIKSGEKLCFICCNTYTTERFKLGPGPLNDSVTVALNHQKRGYKVFFQHNPEAEDFEAFLPVFLRRATKNLTIFFTGHGANVRDRDGDESDGLDEAMVFDKGYVVDDELIKVIHDNANGKTKILLLTDCCHSGSIWDLQSAEKRGQKLPSNILSISAAKDSQTAKQTKMGNKDQGIFSFFFWKLINETPKSTPRDLEPRMNEKISRYKQHFTCFASSQNMLTEPIFT